MFDPVIKWSGSKRSQANSIVNLMTDFDTYYEPFLGGGSVLYAVIKKYNPDSAICGDICKPLIDLWNLIQQNPEYLINAYARDWNRLQGEGYQVYYEIRNRFNSNHAPEDLFFLSRTCVNGLIRFNKNGEFNNSLHHTRKGILPCKVSEVITDWSKTIGNVKFIHADYKDTIRTASSRDVIYLDPPYFNTKGRYYGNIEHTDFLSILKKLNNDKINYILSYDGMRGETSYITNFPKDLYNRHLLLSSGNSAFKKVIDKENQQVLESVYLNF